MGRRCPTLLTPLFVLLSYLLALLLPYLGMDVPMIKLRTRSFLPILALSLSLVGCGPKIRDETDITVAQPGGADRFLWGDYWKLTGLDVPEDRKPAEKIAIAEFSVEFVKERTLRFPDDYGITTRTMNYGPTLEAELPTRLHELFRARLEASGVQLTSVEDVRNAEAYQRYQKRPVGMTPLLRYERGLGSRAGVIRLTKLQPAEGFDVLIDEGAAAQEIDAALRSELGVDNVMRVRFRVGIHKGRSTLEQGSTLRVNVPAGAGALTSLRTLASSGSVLENFGYSPSVNAKGAFNIREKEFLESIDSLFETYAGLVTQALQ